MAAALQPDDVYTWTFQGCPTTVQISLSVLERLKQLAVSTSGDRQGWLWGARGRFVSEVRDFAQLPHLTSNANASFGTDGKTPIGVFAIRDGDSLTLNDEDLLVAAEMVKQPGRTFLLIERRAESPEGCFYLPSGSSVVNFPLLPFPLDSSLLRSWEAQRQASTRTQSETEPDSDPAEGGSFALEATTSLDQVEVTSGGIADNRENPSNRSADRVFRSRNTVSLRLVLLLSVGFLAGSIGTRALLRRPSLPAPVRVAAAAPGNFRLDSLGQGSDLKIRWARADVQTATSGWLEIADGGKREAARLSPEQLKSGSISYSPVNDRVSFRLTLFRGDTPISEGSLLVLKQ